MDQNTASSSEILARVEALAPFASSRDAERAIHATLRALNLALAADERAELARQLPAEWRAELANAEAGPSGEASTLDEFYARVSLAEGCELGRSIEHAQIVCRVLVEEVLDTTTTERFKKHLPPLAPLFELAPSPEPPPRPVHRSPGTPDDLAEGRPGSKHPLADGSARELAHHHSIARSDDPHADTKISSSTGLTQEREGTTLASGRPGSRRPLSDSH